MYEKWMKLINHFWSTIAYWELAKQYIKDQPSGSFFYLTWFAVKDKMLMNIAHDVHLCEQMATQIDIGLDGKKALAELQELYKKGDLDDRSALDFEDCGMKVFRDKVTAHPANQIKEILGKEPYKISVKWETIEATIGKIREFCQAVERQNLDDWNSSSYLEGTGDGADALKSVMRSMGDAKQYDDLKVKVAKAGKPRVWYDWNGRAFVIEG
jgi:hypothetical protein